MRNTIHMQVTIKAAPATVFKALTGSAALTTWFAEHADVNLTEQRYDFWGRFTPGTPDRENGHHAILELESNRAVQFAWGVQGVKTTVEFRLVPRAETTVLVVRQAGVDHGSHQISTYNFEDFWFLSLENLRRYVDGKRAEVRCDFSAPMQGNIQHEIEIDGPASQVFDVLIRPEQLERWIASKATVAPHKGGEYDLGWGDLGGSIKILDITEDKRLATVWSGPESEMIVTWTLAESGGKTRLTLVHSGFAPDQDTSGLNAGWWNFMNWIRSIVEYGPDWQPPIIPLSSDTAALYAGAIKAQQSDLEVYE